MIPLTRSRLNRYNAGVIDLSHSYQQTNGGGSSISNGSTSTSNNSVNSSSNSNGSSNNSRSDRPTAWVAASSSTTAVDSQQPPETNANSRGTESNRKRKFSDKEMEDTKDQQQHRYQPKKRAQPPSIAAYLSGQLHTGTDSPRDESHVTPPPSAAQSLVSALSSTLALIATAATAPTTATKLAPVPLNVSPALARTSSTTTTAMTATTPAAATKPAHAPAPNLASVATRTLTPVSAPIQLQQLAATPKPAPISTPTRQMDSLTQRQPTSLSRNASTSMSVEISSRASTTESTPSSSSSRITAAQDESDEHQPGHTKSDDNGKDANGKLAEGQLQNMALQAQSGRGTHGRFSGATLVEYRKYQVHFKEWCTRKRYTDGDNITTEKFLAYAREVTAREAYEDEVNPHLSIRPIFGIYSGNRRGRINPASMRKRLCAIQFLHREQCHRSGVASNLEEEVKDQVSAFMKEYKRLPKDIFSRSGATTSKKSDDKHASSNKGKVPTARPDRRTGNAASSSIRELRSTRSSAAVAATVDASQRGTKPSISKDTVETISKPALGTITKTASVTISKPTLPATNPRPTSDPIPKPTQAVTTASTPTTSTTIISRPAAASIPRVTPISVSKVPTSLIIPTSTSTSISTLHSASVSKAASTAISTSNSRSKQVFRGTVSAATLLSALLSDSATLPTSPAPISTLVSTSSLASTWTLNPTPTNSTSNLPSTVASNPTSSSKNIVTSAPLPSASTPTGSAPVLITSSSSVSAPMSAPVKTPTFSPLASKSALLQDSSQGSKDGQVSVANSKPDDTLGVAHASHDTTIPEAENRRPSVGLNAKTLLRHRTHQVHWNEWCIRKQCKDGNHVTLEKLIEYATELSAQETFEDKENPHLSIRPLCCKKKPGREPTRVSRYTLAQYVSSIRALHKDQSVKDGLTPSREILGGHRIAAILQDYEMLLKSDTDKKMEASGGGDYLQVHGEGDDVYADINGNQSDVQSDGQGDYPKFQNNHHDNTHHDKEDQEDQDNQDYNEGANNRTVTTLVGLKKSMQALWTTAWRSPSMHMWRNAHQYRVRSALDYFTDVKLNLSKVLPTHLHLVHVWSEDNQALFTTGIAITKTFWKEHVDQEQYSIFLREREVGICPVGAIAFFLLAVWTDKSCLPDFHSGDWRSKTFVSMKSASSTLDSASLLDLPVDLSSENESESSPDALDSSFNSSPLHRLTPLFLPTAQRLGSYMLTASFSEDAAFQLPRNRVLPPAELQRQLFPFIEDFFPDNGDWRTWIDNIMMDRPLDTSRPEKERSYYRAADFPAIQLMRVLACLRKVILQDFAVMMTSEDNGGECQFCDEYECAVQHPVFSTPAFRIFARQLFDAMRTDASSPRSLTVRGDSTDASTDASTDDSTDDLVHDLQVKKNVKTVVAQAPTTDNIQTPLTIRPARQWRHNIQALLSSEPHSPFSMDVQEPFSQDTAGSFQPEMDIFDGTDTTCEQGTMDSSDRDNRLEDELLGQLSPSHVTPAALDQESSSEENSGDNSHNGDNNSHNGDDLDVDTQETEALPKAFIEHEFTGIFEDNQTDQHQPYGLGSSATDAIGESIEAVIEEHDHVQCEPEGSKLPEMNSVLPPTINTEVQDYATQDGNTDLEPLENNLARISINAAGYSHQNNDDNNNNSEQLQQVIRALTVRVASLEREKKRRLEATRLSRSPIRLHPTLEPPSATSAQFSVTAIYQEKRGNPTFPTTISNEVDQRWQENQALRDKLRHLEQENKKALAERSLQLRSQYQSLGETEPTIAMATVAGCLQSDPAIAVPKHDKGGNGNNKVKDDDETEGLQQDIQVLRVQLAAKEQEKNATLDYTMASIESAEFLDTKMVQMEQSMHGLWTMMANSEAARFSMGSTSVGQMQQQQQHQHQHQRFLQVQTHDRHHRLRLRVDAMRRRIESNGYQRP